MIEGLVADFDAENDEVDRRIYFEVTGRQLIDGEFDCSSSSDDDWVQRYDPLSHVVEDEEANDQQVALIGNSQPARASFDDADGK